MENFICCTYEMLPSRGALFYLKLCSFFWRIFFQQNALSGSTVIAIGLIMQFIFELCFSPVFLYTDTKKTKNDSKFGIVA